MPRNKKEQRQEEIMYALYGGTSSPDPYDEIIAAEEELARDLEEMRVRAYVKKLEEPHRLAIRMTFGMKPYRKHTVREAALRMAVSATQAQRLRGEALEQLNRRYGGTRPSTTPALRVIQGGAVQGDASKRDAAA